MAIKKILIVDDSPTERFAMTDLLSKQGYQIVTAENGEQGVATAKAELPDLILMDVVMPGLNIPIILCTSKGEETDKIWGMRQGALDYLVKPVDHAALLAKIAALS